MAVECGGESETERIGDRERAAWSVCLVVVDGLDLCGVLIIQWLQSGKIERKNNFKN